MNTFGRLFRLTTFGESHGKAIGGVIDGCPSNFALDFDHIQTFLNLRRPGSSLLYSQRNEQDKVEFLSGIFQGKTTGAPIAFVIYNKDVRTSDYEQLKDLYRPSHGDYTYEEKYGIHDWRGGGRYSARETAAREVAGAIAMQVLAKFGIKVFAYTSQIGNIKLQKSYKELDLSQIYTNEVRCPDPDVARQMQQLILEVKKQGDTVGGIVTGIIQGVPAGLGEPIYDKISARLAYAMLSIPATKGFEFGSGFSAAQMKGSQHNDLFAIDENGKVVTKTNRSGGIQAGITNGMDIVFRVAFKPVSTVFREQKTINRKMEPVSYLPRGRHDPCPVPRAVPVVQAMAAMTVLDFLLLRQKDDLMR